MPRIIRNTLLNYTPATFETEGVNIKVNPARIYEVNNKSIKDGIILYLCERELRAKDNFALQFALQKSKELNLPLKIIHPRVNYEYLPKQNFIDSQLKQVQKIFQKLNLDFEIVDKKPSEIIKIFAPKAIASSGFNDPFVYTFITNLS